MRIAYQDKSYEEAEEYILSVPKFSEESTPELSRAFYEFLGAPGEGKKIIHVAGTNGKGSVCNYLESCIRDEGRRTGLFISPHLVSVRERFRCLGEFISREEFLDCFKSVSEAVNAFDQYHPCFFEFLFFMAMVWFEKQDVEYIILETGLGGRLDATNVIIKPALTVITKIGLDHTGELGITLEEIAGEKAGIIKKDVPLVFYDTCPETTGIFLDCAEKCGAKAYFVSFSDIGAVKIHEKYIDFCITYGYHSGVYGMQYGFTLPTVASYQAVNASLSVLALHHLEGFKPDKERISECLKRTVWEGRMEELKPDFFVDGAHNPDGIEGLLQSLDLAEVRNAILIFGVFRDKAYGEMLRMLLSKEHFRMVILTGISNPRAAMPDELKKEIKGYTLIEILTARNAEEAFSIAQKKKGRNRIYATGSLSLVGELKELIREEVQ